MYVIRVSISICSYDTVEKKTLNIVNREKRFEFHPENAEVDESIA